MQSYVMYSWCEQSIPFLICFQQIQQTACAINYCGLIKKEKKEEACYTCTGVCHNPMSSLQFMSYALAECIPFLAKTVLLSVATGHQEI